MDPAVTGVMTQEVADPIVEESEVGSQESSDFSSGEDSMDIDEDLLHSEFGIKERLVRQEDIDMKDEHDEKEYKARLIYVEVPDDREDEEGQYFRDAFADLADYDKLRPGRVSLIDPSRVRLSQSRYEQTNKRRKYRRAYNKRPDVIAKRLKDKQDPEKIRKKKEYNSRPETRERKKELQRGKNKLTHSIKAFMPYIKSGQPLSEAQVRELARALDKIQSSARNVRKPSAKKALEAAAKEDAAKSAGL